MIPTCRGCPARSARGRVVPLNGDGELTPRQASPEFGRWKNPKTMPTRVIRRPFPGSAGALTRQLAGGGEICVALQGAPGAAATDPRIIEFARPEIYPVPKCAGDAVGEIVGVDVEVVRESGCMAAACKR